MEHQKLEIAGFQDGWKPSNHRLADDFGGLLKMTNLQILENGSVSLTRGTSKVNSSALSSPPHTIFSKNIGGTRFRFVGCNDGSVRHASGSSFTTGFTGGSDKAAFAAAFDYVYAFTGNRRYKFDGTSWLQTGVTKPTAAPTIVAQTPYAVDISGTPANYTQSEGTGLTVVGDAITFDTDGTSNFAKVENTAAGDYPPLNALSLSAGSGTPDDIFSWPFRPGDSSKLISVRMEILLETPASPGAQVDNYYYFTWVNEKQPTVLTADGRINRLGRFGRTNESAPRGTITQFNEGINAWTTLEARRFNFNRAGTNNTLDWRTVRGVRITVLASETITCASAEMNFKGGDQGPLKGEYQWVQINVNNNGKYLAKSGMGPISGAYNLDQTYANITPDTMPVNANEMWIFRRGGTLEQFYRVAVRTVGGAFADKLSDLDAKQLNIKLNENVLSVNSTDLPDEIFDIVPQFYGRFLYFTQPKIYVSSPDDPESYDPANAISYGGTSSEIFYWARKVASGSILVGTSVDIYELSGTFAQLPDGTLDARIRPLGVENPPVSRAVTTIPNFAGVVYFCKDGWSTISVSGVSESLTGIATDTLYKGYTRYDYSPAAIPAANENKFDCCYASNQLWTVNTLQAGSRRVEVFDFKRRSWYPVNLAPSQLFTEENGAILAGFTDDSFIRNLDTGTLLDGTTGQAISFLTPFLQGNSRQRKQFYTIKFQINTGGVNVTCNLYKDEGTVATQSFNVNSNGLSTVSVDLYSSSPMGIGRNIQVELIGSALVTFNLVSISIEYDFFQSTLTAKREFSVYFGSPGRKRVSTISFRADTLGNNVTVTPYVDGIAQNSLVINSTTFDSPIVFNYHFTSDKLGTDFELRFTGGTIEFYGILMEQSVYEMLPSPHKYAFNNYQGFQSHKRKRMASLPIVINTKGQNVTVTPYIDGAAGTPVVVNNSVKKTEKIYFPLTLGTDFAIELSGSFEWELHEILWQAGIYEILPAPATDLFINYQNYNTSARKRITTIPIVIDTGGQNCTFTPYLDGVAQLPLVINTARKTTINYQFTADALFVDIAFVLDAATAIEYYEILYDKAVVEILPSPKKFLFLNYNNLGIPNKKRIRVLPFIINTKGGNVDVTPYFDGVAQSPATVNCSYQKTEFYFVNTDQKVIDVAMQFSGAAEFELLEGLFKPEIVEIFPIWKHFDQIGPMDLSKIGKIYILRIRLISTATQNISYTLYLDDVSQATGTVAVTANVDKTYEIQFPKGKTGNILRIEFVGNSLFHRHYGEIQVARSGKETEVEWIPITDNVE